MKRRIVGTLMGLCAIVLLIGGCQSTRRAVKNTSSEIAGLSRKVVVYSMNGNKVLFDKDGKRIVIYNGTVIAEEK